MRTLRWLLILVLFLSALAHAGKVLPIQAIGMEKRDWRGVAVEQMIFGYLYPEVDLGAEGQPILAEFFGVQPVSVSTVTDDLRQLPELAYELIQRPARPIRVEETHDPLLRHEIKQKIEADRLAVAFLEGDKAALIVGYEEYAEYGLVLVVYDPFPYGEGEHNPYFKAGGWKAYGPHSYMVPYDNLIDLGWASTIVVGLLKA